MKRYFGVFLALVLLLLGLAAVASADYINKEQVRWTEDGSFLMDTSTGKVIEFTGWRKVAFKYENEDGSIDTWTSWFYGEGKGKLAEGWKQIGGVWYYFWPEMCTDSWYDQSNDTVYLFEQSGAWTGVSTKGVGWLNLNNKWYYVEKYTEEYEDWTYTWKYFYTNGNYKINNTVYWFKNGVMQSNGWVDYTWKSDDGTSYTNWLYANPDGSLATGWKLIDGKWYYFSSWGWMYKDGVYEINGKNYAFEKSGAMKANQWHPETWTWDNGKKEIHWLYLGADGAARTGWFKDGNIWYYADSYGWMLSDCWLEDNGSMYYMTKSGAMATGWKQIGGDWFYFKAGGAMAKKEWILDGGTWYYLGEGGAMYSGGTYNIGGKDWSFAASGAWIAK